MRCACIHSILSGHSADTLRETRACPLHINQLTLIATPAEPHYHVNCGPPHASAADSDAERGLLVHTPHILTVKWIAVPALSSRLAPLGTMYLETSMARLHLLPETLDTH